jgi:hypothetical protein
MCFLSGFNERVRNPTESAPPSPLFSHLYRYTSKDRIGVAGRKVSAQETGGEHDPVDVEEGTMAVSPNADANTRALWHSKNV